MQAVGHHYFHYFLVSLNIIFVAMATSIAKSENKLEIDHLHPKCFRTVKML